MKVLRSIGDVQKDPGSVIAVGTFDGVHMAHREIIREVVNRSRMREGRSVIVTFEPHPTEVVGSSKSSVPLLTTLEERVELLRALNIDLLLIIDFTYEFSRLSSWEFYEKYLVDGIGVSEVVVGYDHMFGRDREAGVQELVGMGKEFDFSVFAVHPYTIKGEIVSSTQIRSMLASGNVERAADFLGYPFSVRGRVVRGDGRGKAIGFPTANLKPETDKKVVPANGVYFVAVRLNEKQYFGMMNIGVRPTVTQGGERTLEVHVFDMNEDVYGDELHVTFLRKLRDEQKFTSLEELSNQLGMDRERSLRLIAEHTKTH